MKKTIKIILNTITTIIIITGMIFIFLYLIGIEPFVVESGSMEPQIPVGSLSFINKKIKYENIRVDDVIAYKLESGKRILHRAVAITDEGIQTKGDANNTTDGVIVTKENYIGKNTVTIPKVGYAVKIIQTPRGKIILGTTIIVLILAAILIGEPSKKNPKYKQ